ncbi:P1 family peptidase [uncultured Chitinophaga sp.]|jgi:L-aminopeptidase/D-esterase|uniref:DmpA family aminopeptidase n=1 Tax=uncultured Chitinophaga sp. TaxID=339340 RepID=UPI0026049BDA|nr:P1 family peptidase [uncultured Chitinophaga sp.]
MRYCIVALLLIICGSADAQRKERARDLGIPFEGQPGAYNAITDVAGVEVGYSTIVKGKGAKAVRTGVTAILPRGNKHNPVYAAWYTLNGNGEMTGTTWVEESGFLETPVMITNTNSVGITRDAVLKWVATRNWFEDNELWWGLPVVAETYDGILNDILGFHVKEEHVFAALDSARGGPIAEGNVGGGTGMMCLGFKGGTGTSSRVVNIAGKKYTVGALVQSNFGARKDLTITGVPVGKLLGDTLPYRIYGGPDNYTPGTGSIIVVIATDAPLLPHQLKRLAQRVPIGVGLTGGKGHNSSGDIFLAFSTANEKAYVADSLGIVQQLPNEWIDPLFEATIQSTEEAIINAMTAAETMEGVYGNTAYALPHHKVKALMQEYIRDIPGKELKPDAGIRLSKELLDTYSGTYTNSLASPVIITSKDGKLQLARGEGAPTRELLPVAKDVFMIKGNFVRIVFNRELQQLAVEDDSIEMVYKKKAK